MTYQKGFSLVEIVLVTAIIGSLALLILSIPSSLASIQRSRHVSIAKTIAAKEVESLRRLTFANLANGTSQFTDADLSLLPQGNASYTISDCPQTICKSSESIKQASITVSWNESGKNQNISLDTLIGSGGLGQ